MIRLIRPLTMMATESETEVATPMFCSTTQDRKVLFAGKTQQQVAHLRDDHRREPLGGFVHHQQARDCSSNAREIASICCSPPGKLAAAVVAPLRRRGKVE